MNKTIFLAGLSGVSSAWAGTAVSENTTALAGLVVVLVLSSFSLGYLWANRRRTAIQASQPARPPEESGSGASEPQNSLDEVKREQLKVVATLSHELRTPLHAILGLSELLLTDETIPKPALRHLDKINSAARGLLDSLNKAIEAARSDSGTLQLTPEETDLLAAIEDTLRTFIVAIEGKGLHLSLKFDPRLFTTRVLVDRVHLQQVLNNLIGNAIKFTDQGTISVWVACRRRTGDTLDLYFAVSDTGVGIPVDSLEAVLKPFGQVSTAQKGRPLGAGLGLSICNDLVTKLGGQLDLVSVEGEVSRFSFTLSLKELPAQRTKPKMLGTPKVTLISPANTGSEVMKTLLSDWGATVFYHSDLETELFSTHTDLLIIDESLVEGNLGAIKRLALQVTPGRLVILRAEEYTIDLKGVPDYNELFKPILPSQLAALVESSGLTSRLQARLEVAAKPVTDERPDVELTVLAVDDSPTNLLLLKAQLNKIGGTRVITAKNGAEALEKAEEGRIDLILMDFNMPVMDGVTAASHLREQGFSRPIIGLTALDNRATEVAENSHLFDKILNKPAGLDEIMRVIGSARDLMNMETAN